MSLNHQNKSSCSQEAQIAITTIFGKMRLEFADVSRNGLFHKSREVKKMSYYRHLVQHCYSFIKVYSTIFFSSFLLCLVRNHTIKIALWTRCGSTQNLFVQEHSGTTLRRKLAHLLEFYAAYSFVVLWLHVTLSESSSYAHFLLCLDSYLTKLH